jgi:hypothetical protein
MKFKLRRKVLIFAVCLGLAAPAIASWKSVTKGAGKVANDTGNGIEKVGNDTDQGFKKAGGEIDSWFETSAPLWSYTCKSESCTINNTTSESRLRTRFRCEYSDSNIRPPTVVNIEDKSKSHAKIQYKSSKCCNSSVPDKPGLSKFYNIIDIAQDADSHRATMRATLTCDQTDPSQDLADMTFLAKNIQCGTCSKG